MSDKKNKDGKKADQFPNGIMSAAWTLKSGQLQDWRRERARNTKRFFNRIGHDYRNTFKPYKYIGKVGKDFLQLPRGVLNIMAAIFKLVRLSLLLATMVLSMVTEPLSFAVKSGFYVRNKQSNKGFLGFLKGMVAGLAIGFLAGVVKFTSMLVHAPIEFFETACTVSEPVVQALYGALQIVSYPLVPFRITLRGLLTLFVGAPKIEESTKLQAAVDNLGEPFDALKIRRDALYRRDFSTFGKSSKELKQLGADKIHDKLNIRREKGQPTNINKVDETTCYKKLKADFNEETVKAYKALFKPVNTDNAKSIRSSDDSIAPNFSQK